MREPSRLVVTNPRAGITGLDMRAAGFRQAPPRVLPSPEVAPLCQPMAQRHADPTSVKVTLNATQDAPEIRVDLMQSLAPAGIR